VQVIASTFDNTIPYQKFKFIISETKDSINEINISAFCNGGNTNSNLIYVKVWNQTNWATVASDNLGGFQYHNITINTTSIPSIVDSINNNGELYILFQATQAATYNSNVSVDFIELKVNGSRGASNPQTSSAVLNEGESFYPNWTINVTSTTENEKYLLDVLFNSSFGNSNVPDNNTEDRRIILNTGAGSSECGSLDIENKSCTLTGNISSLENGFNITAQNITLDCGGNYIIGSNVPNSKGILINSSNVTIMNCKFSNFPVDIYVVNANNLSLYNITGGSAYGLIVNGTTNSNFTDISFNNITTAGILVTNNSHGNTFTDININSSAHGIYIDSGQNNTFDCANGLINYSIGGEQWDYGVYSNQFNTTVKNCNISLGNSTSSEISRHGIYFDDSDNGLIYNNTLICNSSDSYGVYFQYSDYNNILNNTISSYEDYALDIYLDSSYNNISYNIINSTNTYSLHLQIVGDNNFLSYNILPNGGIHFQGYSNNTIISNMTIPSIMIMDSGHNFTVIDSIITEDVYIGWIGDPGEWNFTNVTDENGDRFLIIDGDNSDGVLNIRWYLDTNVTYSNGTAIENANVSIYDVNNNLLFTENTSSQGIIERKTLLEYSWYNDTSVYSEAYYTPHTINVTKPGFIINSTSYNLTELHNVFANIFLEYDIPDTTYPNATINSPTGTFADITPLINISISENSNVWYNIDNGTNITLCNNCNSSQNKFLYAEEGEHIIYIFANDSAGNLNSSIYSSFTIDMNNNYYDSFNDNSSLYSKNNVIWNQGNITFSAKYNYLEDPNLVSVYEFQDIGNLGIDTKGNNNMSSVGDPAQNNTVPPGFEGYSIQLDGDDQICNHSGFTFNPSTNHTMCFWVMKTDFTGDGNVFAQNCVYDTWDNDAEYIFTANNCYNQESVSIEGVYYLNQWVHICQTYDSTTDNMTFYINGDENSSHVFTNTIEYHTDQAWCIGGCDGGCWMTGNVFEPMWFERTLNSEEIGDIYDQGGFNQGNFTSYPINTTQNITEITNITWIEINTEANNNITVEVSADGGSNWYNATSGGALGQTFTGANNSLVYRVFFSTNSSTTIAISDMNISWSNEEEIVGENACGTLDAANTVYTLTSNVSSQGSCFTITQPNITLDCNNYWINYSINGTDYGRGIYTNQLNTTIRNCNIIDGNITNTNIDRQGIYFYQSSNGTIENNTVISNNSQAVHLRLNSNFNNVTNNMFHGFSDIGLDLHTSNNNNVTNNLMIIDSNVDSALVVYQSSNNFFMNNTGIGGGYGMYVVGTTSISSNNNLFINNTALSDIGDAIRLVLGQDNTFINQIAISSSLGDYAVIIDDVNNTKFIDCTNLTASPTQIYIHTGTSLNNSFINCSYNSEWIREGETELIRKWYYQAYTNYSNGTAVENANISAYNTTGQLEFTALTNSSGWMGRQEVTEYINTGGTRIYYNNYTINATLSGYETDSNILNITETQNKLDDVFTLESSGPADCTTIGNSGVLDSVGTTYTLTENISSQGTCLTISAANVTLDCNGYWINYTGNDVGDYFGIETNQFNSTVKNCNIYNFTIGVFFNGADNGTIENNNITLYNNKTLSIDDYGLTPRASGILIYNSANYNTILNNTAYSYYGRGIYINDADNNIIENSNGTSYFNPGIQLFDSSNNTINNSFALSEERVGIWLGYYGDHNSIINSTAISTLEVAILSDYAEFTNIINSLANSSSAGGIYLLGVSNSNIINSTGISLSDDGITITYGSHNNTIFNSTGIGDHTGISIGENTFDPSNNNTVLDSKGIGGVAGIFLGGNNHTTIRNNATGGNEAYHIASLNNSQIIDCVYSYGGLNDVYYSDSLSRNNTFLNCSYVDEYIGGVDGELIRKWYYQAYVNDSFGTAIEDANVTAYNTTGDLQFTALTNSTGHISRQEVIEYVNTGGTRSYYNNYTINATLTGYETDSNSLNITETQNKIDDAFTLNELNKLISVWDTRATSPSSTNSSQVGLPLTSNGIYDFTVYWGDGNSNAITSWNDANVNHTYASEGVYTINITGTIQGWRFNNAGDRLKILEIKNWGPLNLGNNGGYFYNASNLQITATDILNLTGTTTLLSAFRECKNITTVPGMNGWDISNVTTLRETFYGASSFNENISNWNTSNVNSLYHTFNGALLFNQPIGNWNTSKVTQMERTFSSANSFNQHLNSWDTSKVTSMYAMFWNASDFNQDLNLWNTSNVDTMSYLFYMASSFNGSLETWDTSKVTALTSVFLLAPSFNRNISNWNTSKVTTMQSMFLGASDFNQDIGSWDTSNVINMRAMFHSASSFNQNISNWNTSKVTDMYDLFYTASSFNQNISGWDTSNVGDMSHMFDGASSFNQNLSNWNISNVSAMEDMFYGATLSTENYDSLLIGWSSQLVKNSVQFHAGNSKYSNCSINNATAARAVLTDTYSWTITDGGFNSSYECPFVPGENACGVLDTANTVYTLTQNVSSQGTCFTITQPNITLDCNGYSINYSIGGEADTGGIHTTQFNTTIKNCNVIDGNWTSSENTRYGIFFDTSDNGSISNSFVNVSNSNAVVLTGDADFNNIINNSFNSLSSAGIFIHSSDDNVLINNSLNSISGSGLVIMLLSTHQMLINNTGTSSSGFGFYIENSNYNTFINSTGFSEDYPGFYLGSGSNYNSLINVKASSLMMLVQVFITQIIVMLKI
jgi:surface protein/parallel beta-helix repeat protein